MTIKILLYGINFAPELAGLSIFALLALPAWIGSALLMLAPGPFWARFLREQKWELLFVLACAAAYKAVTVVFPDTEGAISDVLFPPTVYFVNILDSWLGYQVGVDVATKMLSVGPFAVEIAFPCLGSQGVRLTLLFLSGHLYIARRELRFPNVLIVIPIALLAIWLLNAVRIALLMAIGAAWSPDIALQGFHSAAGWWSLTLVALASVLATRKFGFFTKQPASASVRLTDEQILLLPQLTLLAVALATLLFTASFDW